MKKLIVVLVLLATSQCYANPLIDYYDQIFDHLGSSEYTLPDGYLLSDSGGVHQVTSSLISIPADYRNLPQGVTRATETKIFGRYCVVSDNAVYFSIDKDFLNQKAIRIKDEVVTDWHLFSINEDTIQLRYAHLFYNTDYVESLVDMYALTGKTKYLKRANSILKHIRVRSDGRIKRQFANEEPYYNGMIQSYAMRAMYKYLQYVPLNGVISNKLKGLCKSFVFTSEGVWNHWNNAIMGSIIADRVLGTHNTNYSNIEKWYKNLDSMIVEFDGRIPKNMKRSSPNHPYFDWYYQGHDVKLIAQIKAEYYDVSFYRKHFKDSLQRAIEFSTLKPNNVNLRMRIQEAILYSQDTFEIDYSAYQDEFEQWLLEQIKNKPEGVNDPVYLACCISLYLRYSH